MKYLLVDALNLAYRAFYGIPELRRADGFPTNAIHGWVKGLWKLENMESPDQILVCWDIGRPAAREALLPSYKANRSETPEDLKKQLPLLREVTELMGFPSVGIEGIEADDIIGAYAKLLGDQGHEVYIVSSDKDLAQCIKANVKQMLPPPTANPRLGWRKLDEAGVLAKFGVTVAQIPDYLALMGDNSDNIPGIPGVGPKTASKWLKSYKTIDGIFQHSAMLKPKRFCNIVYENQELLKRNLKLTLLDESFDIDPVDHDIKPDIVALKEFFLRHEMKKSAEDADSRYSQG